MEIYFKNRFYPQNFVILKSDNTDSIIENLSYEAASLAPDCFDAETPCFNFILHYQPPYSEFTELKRLQAEAIKNTRFKDEYRGYIAIDISEWTNHFGEDFFIIALTFLSDMSDSWKYIFLLDKENALTNVSQTFERLVPDMRVFNIKTVNSTENDFAEELNSEVRKTYKKSFTPSAKMLLQRVFNTKTCTKDVITNSAKDIALYFLNEAKISESLIAEYLSDDLTYLYAHMTSEERIRFNDYISENEVKR